VSRAVICRTADGPNARVAFLPFAFREIFLMFLQDLFRALQSRRRLAEQRSERHGVEITKRLRELRETSPLVAPDSNPLRKPNQNDRSHVKSNTSRTV